MNNLRGRLGSTRQVRGLGCDTDSSTNLEGIIEGTQRHCNSETYAMVSDLSPFPLSERFDARLHGAGINDEENAGQRNNIDERHIARQRFGLSHRTVGATSWSGDSMAYGCVGPVNEMTPHCYRNHNNPCAEKGMHIRSQQIFLAGAGWVLRSDAHARGVAVTQRLRSANFGGGATCLIQELQRSGVDEVALPRLQNLL
jgi:hypothetical protein